MTTVINSFAISGYRSFGKEPQYFESLKKINLIIGKNNSGKSNLLRFFTEKYSSSSRIDFDVLDHHMPSREPFTFGFSVSLEKDEKNGQSTNFLEYIYEKLDKGLQSSQINDTLMLLSKRAELTGKQDAWFFYDQSLKFILDGWEDSFNVLKENNQFNRVKRLHTALTNSTGGSLNAWIAQIVQVLQPKAPSFKPVFIPAFRQIQNADRNENQYCGSGVIEELAKLQNPDFLNQGDKKKFEEINNFLRSVTNNETATIDIPHARNTVLVHMDGKTLPLEALGTGIHEVIILASAATIHENCLICMEEPELHLNPLLQRKLLRYLSEQTSNQYLITTHSSSLIDTQLAEIYHVRLENGESRVRRVTTDRDKSSICEDLGYHPSDLVQANCIIWVEGPSDRIYLNNWIKEFNPRLIEGIHYSIMFYGGRLSSHLSAKDVDEDIETFISLRRLNRRSVIVIDSDKKTSHARINDTKKRLKEEFNEGPGFAWITSGREIENYIEEGKIREAIKAVHPKTKIKENVEGKYCNLLNVFASDTSKSANKVKVANYVVENFEVNFKVLDLNKQLNKLVEFILDSNPSL